MSDSSREEIECKFLDVNPKELARKLEKFGAQREFKQLFRRYVFDYPDWRLNAQKSWIRVRDEGHQVRLGYKQRKGVLEGKQDTGMYEVEVTVSDFDDTVEFLYAIGLKPKFYEENWRTLYTLGDVEFAIDEWPLIPPYLEVESSSWDKVDVASRKLGFDPKERLVCSTTQVYEHYGIDELGYEKLTFEEQIKRKK